jgi:hypothetical protein
LFDQLVLGSADERFDSDEVVDADESTCAPEHRHLDSLFGYALVVADGRQSTENVDDA